jgi:hypothetical protein
VINQKAELFHDFLAQKKKKKKKKKKEKKKRKIEKKERELMPHIYLS